MFSLFLALSTSFSPSFPPSLPTKLLPSKKRASLRAHRYSKPAILPAMGKDAANAGTLPHFEWARKTERVCTQ